jgi:hypothetical protein
MPAPSPSAARTRIFAGGGLLLAAALGATAGHLVRAHRASACDCSPHSWQLVREDVTSSDPATTHQAFWPEGGRLSAYPGSAIISADHFVAGVIASAEARR